MNIFEGARRITHAMAAVLLAFTVFVNLDRPSDMARFTAMTAAFVYGFSWVIGWIVRGFMGIPRGSDRKPAP